MSDIVEQATQARAHRTSKGASNSAGKAKSSRLSAENYPSLCQSPPVPYFPRRKGAPSTASRSTTFGCIARSQQCSTLRQTDKAERNED